MLPDDQVHPDTHVLTMVNNVIEVVNYVIAARPSPLNSVIADIGDGQQRQVDDVGLQRVRGWPEALGSQACLVVGLELREHGAAAHAGEPASGPQARTAPLRCRAIEVLLDRDAVISGAAATGQPC